MRDLRKRLETAIQRLDTGVPVTLFRKDPLLATNRVLRSIGRPQVKDLNSRAQLLRAVIFIEDEASWDALRT